jgi:serine/threonine protein kinase
MVWGSKTYGMISCTVSCHLLINAPIASPEKCRFMNDFSYTNPQEIGLNSDIWSLGCVFSLMATFCVLGKQGILQYHTIRLRAPSKLQENDLFHDGSHVLPEIRKWHTYLSGTARKTDNITAEVLKLVDDFMLVDDPKSRADAAYICKGMTTVIHDFGCKESLELDPSIEQLLGEINEDVLVPEHSSLGTQDRRDNPNIEETQDRIRVNVTTEEVSASEKKLLAQAVLPTVHRTNSHRSSINLPGYAEPGSSGQTESSRVPRNIYTSQGLMNQYDEDLARAKRFRNVRTLWNVLDELERRKEATGLPQLLTERVLKRKISTKEQKKRGFDELGDFFDGRDIVSLQ